MQKRPHPKHTLGLSWQRKHAWHQTPSSAGSYVYRAWLLPPEKGSWDLVPSGESSSWEAWAFGKRLETAMMHNRCRHRGASVCRGEWKVACWPAAGLSQGRHSGDRTPKASAHTKAQRVPTRPGPQGPPGPTAAREAF